MKQSAQIQSQTVNNGIAAAHVWPHLKLDFLQPDKIRDIQRRTLKDPNYDPRTLYVPIDFLNNQTPVRILSLSYLLSTLIIIKS